MLRISPYLSAKSRGGTSFTAVVLCALTLLASGCAELNLQKLGTTWKKQPAAPAVPTATTNATVAPPVGEQVQAAGPSAERGNEAVRVPVRPATAQSKAPAADRTAAVAKPAERPASGAQTEVRSAMPAEGGRPPRVSQKLPPDGRTKDAGKSKEQQPDISFPISLNVPGRSAPPAKQPKPGTPASAPTAAASQPQPGGASRQRSVVVAPKAAASAAQQWAAASSVAPAASAAGQEINTNKSSSQLDIATAENAAAAALAAKKLRQRIEVVNQNIDEEHGRRSRAPDSRATREPRPKIQRAGAGSDAQSVATQKSGGVPTGIKCRLNETRKLTLTGYVCRPKQPAIVQK